MSALLRMSWYLANASFVGMNRVYFLDGVLRSLKTPVLLKASTNWEKAGEPALLTLEYLSRMTVMSLVLSWVMGLSTMCMTPLLTRLFPFTIVVRIAGLDTTLNVTP